MSTTQNTEVRQRQLIEWNQARAIASRLIEAFYEGHGDLAEVEDQFAVSFPDRAEYVSQLLELRGRRFSKTNQMARRVLEW